MTTSMRPEASRIEGARRASTVGMSGWYAFAACMLLIAGASNMIHGYVALNQSEFLVNQLLWDNLDVWGWVFLGWGALQVVAGGMSLAMRSLGPIIGVVLASIAMLLWFTMVFAAPFAAIIGLAINGAVVFGLTRVVDDERVA